MKETELLKSAIADINRLSLTGAANWEIAAGAIKKIFAVIQSINAKECNETGQKTGGDGE